MEGKRPRVYRSIITVDHLPLESASKLTQTLLDFFGKVAYRVYGDSSSMSGVVYHKRVYITEGGVSVLEHTEDHVDGEYQNTALSLTSFNSGSLKNLEKKLLRLGNSVKKRIFKKVKA